MLLSTIMCLGQEAWELPMKDDMVYFQFKEDGFNNKNKPLKAYYIDHLTKRSGESINSQLSTEMSKKGGKYFSNTDYNMYYTPGSCPRMKHGKDGRADTIDCETITITTITTNKHILHVFGEKTSNFSVVGKIKIIFTSNGYLLNIRGFKIYNQSVNAKKGSVQTNESYIEDSYKEFLAEKKKDKAEIKFYSELKELISSYNSLLKDQLLHEVKVNEMD